MTASAPSLKDHVARYLTSLATWAVNFARAGGVDLPTVPMGTFSRGFRSSEHEIGIKLDTGGASQDPHDVRANDRNRWISLNHVSTSSLLMKLHSEEKVRLQ